ncbi:MXAN_6577-like cysteine-rich protein [Myxococcus faecalis]|uniref:MXAN_6577-like cysteine-rich protein n=1 Tax=Myxococcus faecalis TaxID=3115646 RepID=UPI003CF9C816
MLPAHSFIAPRRLVLSLLCASALVLTGCPDEGVVCTSGLVVCDGACVDTRGDTSHCGACGTTCSSGEVCQDGACGCRAGTESCNGACVDTATDVAHCGACGSACAAGQVCESGTCREGCSEGLLRCSGACVDGQSDALHCGACGNVCPDAQSCRAGRCTYDVVAACFTNGQLVGLQAGTDQLGPRREFGAGIQALASWDGFVLGADMTNGKLLQALGGNLGALVEEDSLGVVSGSPNDILVDPPHVYVIDSVNNTLQVLRRDGPSHGNGLGLRTVGQLNLGPNTSPQALARFGDLLYIPLFGTGSSNFQHGNAVARVDISDPTQPRKVDTLSLTGLDLKPFDGTGSMPLPFSVTATRTHVYVALTNLNPANDYRPNGPGMLARIDPATGAVSAIDLGKERCLNAGYVEAVGDQLVVACIGEAIYDTANGYLATSVRSTGLVLVKNDVPVASYALNPGCQPGAPGCMLSVASRFAVSRGAVYLADTNAGRIFVVEVGDGTLTERRGYSTPTAKGPALEACPVDPRRPVSNAIDVTALH